MANCLIIVLMEGASSCARLGKSREKIKRNGRLLLLLVSILTVGTMVTRLVASDQIEYYMNAHEETCVVEGLTYTQTTCITPGTERYPYECWVAYLRLATNESSVVLKLGNDDRDLYVGIDSYNKLLRDVGSRYRVGDRVSCYSDGTLITISLSSVAFWNYSIGVMTVCLVSIAFMVSQIPLLLIKWGFPKDTEPTMPSNSYVYPIGDLELVTLEDEREDM